MVARWAGAGPESKPAASPAAARPRPARAARASVARGVVVRVLSAPGEPFVVTLQDDQLQRRNSHLRYFCCPFRLTLKCLETRQRHFACNAIVGSPISH